MTEILYMYLRLKFTTGFKFSWGRRTLFLEALLQHYQAAHLGLEVHQNQEDRSLQVGQARFHRTQSCQRLHTDYLLLAVVVGPSGPPRR